MIPGLLPILLHGCKIKSGLGTRLQYNMYVYNPHPHTHTHTLLWYIFVSWWTDKVLSNQHKQWIWTKEQSSHYNNIRTTVYWLHCTTSSLGTKALNNNWGQPRTASDISWAGPGNEVTLNVHKQLIHETPLPEQKQLYWELLRWVTHCTGVMTRRWRLLLYASLASCPVLRHSYCHLQYE